MFKRHVYNKLSELTRTENIVEQLNSVLTNSTIENIVKYRQKKQSWITNELVDMCELRRKIKKKDTKMEALTKKLT